MLKLYRRWREKKLAAQQEQEQIEKEKLRLMREKQEAVSYTHLDVYKRQVLTILAPN